ncbi:MULTISPECIES: LysR substrate-binding domain-containing protein [unclassified Mesorhizobium]|uniref:LysR substrate-binding domain-containing protein n=1 Tax=unclassified Mesorhizobium TaxID=325217 RepID=UPI001CCB70AB|nr:MULTISPECIES: LysR substrate-binding domain-containing protein [unclassified Mesorhizobium]MBZ9982410.1 LysR family transcriptional regulator [Mesorhizobium sp. BR-1-1-8]
MTSTLNLLHYSAFRAVMLTGTVSGAAELLGRSQPAVSRLLDKLEYELGVSLFERRRGLITPTSVAHLLLDEIERAYVSLDALSSFAARLASGEGGEISLAVMPALGINFVPHLLADFRKDWPKTKVTLNVRMSVKIEEWAAAQQIDFGLAETPFKRSGFRTEVFSDAPYIAAVPRDHPLAGRSRLGPADLRQGPFISWTSFVSARHLLDQALLSSSVKVDAAYETTFSVSAYEMVKHGIGIAIIDPYTAVEQLDDRVRLIPFAPKIPFNVALLRPESRGPNPAADALLELMAQKRDRILRQLPDQDDMHTTHINRR